MRQGAAGGLLPDRAGQNRVKTLNQTGFQKTGQVRAPAATELLAELLGHRFRQVLFQFGGQPALQHGPLIGLNHQRTQPGASVFIAPANFGLNLEMRRLAGQHEENANLCPGLQGGRSGDGQAALADIDQAAIDFVGFGHEGC